MSKRSLALIAITVLAAPSTAAAGEWRTIGDISPRDRTSAGISYGVDGAGVLTVLYRDFSHDDEVGAVQVRDREPREPATAGATFDPGGPSLVDLAVAPAGPRVAAYGSGPDGNARVELRFRATEGEWSQPVVVGQGFRRVANVRVEVAPSGEVVVAWLETATRSEQQQAPSEQRLRTTLYATGQRGDGSFHPPQALGTTEGFTFFSLETDDDGNAVVAWLDESAEAARTARRRAGGTFGSSEQHVVPGLPVRGGSIDLAVAPGGRAVISWPVGEADGVGRSPHAATAGTTTGGFDPPTVVSRNAGEQGSVAAGDRIAAVTWVEDPSVRGRVRSILAAPDEKIGDRAARTVSRRGVRHFGSGQTTAARGRVTYAWDRQFSGDRVVEARTATSSGDFTSLQTLSSRSHESFSTTTATSRRGEPWVAWVSREPRKRLSGVQTAKASSRDGKFGRTLRLPRVPSLDLLELIPGRGGTMFVLQRPEWLRLNVYGEGR